MMARLLAVLAVLTAMLGASGAEARCGNVDPDNPCAIPGGHYRIILPKNGRAPYKTVLYLYGSLGNSQVLTRSRRFVEAFTSRGYALIVPAGLNLNYASGKGSGWFLRNTRTPKERDDARFVRDVLQDAETRFAIDRRNVLMAGMSNGGFLAWEIACHEPQMAKAYAPVGAGYLGPMPSRCAAPVRILHTHGLADQIVTIDGSGDRRVSGGARVMLLDETLNRMAATDGCTGRSTPEQFLNYTRTSWEGCQGGSVDLLVHGGGHTIPDSWYDLVLDWFEKPLYSVPQIGGGTARFRNVGERGGQFRSAGRSTGRFKRVTD
jgi:polyhydroxybutyrate depolymerase